MTTKKDVLKKAVGKAVKDGKGGLSDAIKGGVSSAASSALGAPKPKAPRYLPEGQEIAPFNDKGLRKNIDTGSWDRVTSAAESTKNAPSWAPKDKNKVKISGPSQLKNYANIEKRPGSVDMYGILKPVGKSPVTPEYVKSTCS